MTFKPLVTGEQEQQHRQWWPYLFEQVGIGKAKTGVLAGLGVTATTPAASGSVVVGAGAGLCQPTTAGGLFPLVAPANETVDVFTANPMQFVNNPRNDIVGIDQTTGLVTVITGASNAIPDDPAIPTTVLPLARLRHGANATTIPKAGDPASGIDDLRVKVDLFHKDDPVWAAIPSFEPGASSDGTSPAQYRVWPNGKVELRGRINAGTTFAGSGVQVATLPLGAHPSAPRHFSTGHSFATANTSDSRVTVNADGSIWLYTQAAQTTWFALDGAYFYLT